ncbi:MAG TPA: ATPase [Clostridiales bacterium]|nr:ATPase [Clostridiales bacterium]
MNSKNNISLEKNVNEKMKSAKLNDVEKSIQKKFHKDIFCKFCKAINEYKLIEPNDKIAVCISGGKDSMLLAKLFQELKRHNKFNFDVEYLVMDPGYNKENRELIEHNAKLLNIPITIFESKIFDNVSAIEKYPCYICARMRRGHLYAKAKELGCNKIALGHHFDDVIETTLMSMLYGGQIETMMPKLHSENFDGMELIRPLYFVREKDILHWRDYNKLKFLQCACKFTELCEKEMQDNKELSSKRKKVKNIIASLSKEDKQIENSIFKSTQNVNLAKVLEYKDKNGVRHNFLDEY